MTSTKSGQLRVRVAAVVAATGCLICAKLLSAQPSSQVLDKNWSAVRDQLAARANSIHYLYAEGLLDDYKSRAVRDWVSGQYKLNHGALSAPYPQDPNYVAAFTWAVDRSRWRHDIRRVYPQLGHDFKQVSFDGERITSYNEYRNFGYYGSVPDQDTMLYFSSDGDFQTINADSVVGTGGLTGMEHLWISNHETPTWERQEQHGGVLCSVFHYSHRATDGLSTVDIWYAPVMHAIVKYVYTGLDPVSMHGGETTYSASDFRKINNIYIPFNAKSELYDVKGSHPSEWKCSRQVKFNDVEINDPASVSTFSHIVRPTSEMANSVTNPGQFTCIGGPYQADVEKVRLGVPPPVEDANAIVEGKDPVVSEAQTASELH